MLGSWEARRLGGTKARRPGSWKAVKPESLLAYQLPSFQASSPPSLFLTLGFQANNALPADNGIVYYAGRTIQPVAGFQQDIAADLGLDRLLTLLHTHSVGNAKFVCTSPHNGFMIFGERDACGSRDECHLFVLWIDNFDLKNVIVLRTRDAVPSNVRANGEKRRIDKARSGSNGF